MTQGPNGEGKGKPNKKLKIQDGTQRGWVYVTESGAPGLTRHHHFKREKGIKVARANPRWVPKGKDQEKENSHPLPKAKAKLNARQKD